jgi:hypothetical protein
MVVEMVPNDKGSQTSPPSSTDLPGKSERPARRAPDDACGLDTVKADAELKKARRRTTFLEEAGLTKSQVIYS